MIEPWTRAYQSHTLTLSDAVALMPFGVLAPTKLPWPEDEVEQVEVRYLSPLMPGYFARLDFFYRHKGGAWLHIREGDTNPRIDPTLGIDFSESDEIERGGRTLRIISPNGDAGPWYVAFHHRGTHVVILASDLSREQAADVAASFKAVEREPWLKVGDWLIRRGPVAIGAILGLFTGIADGALSPRDFSSVSMMLWICFFGLSGFIVSLLFNDRGQSRKFQIIVGTVTVMLLLAPGLRFRHELTGPKEFSEAILVSVIVIAFSTYTVGAIWAIIRLIRLAATSSRSNAELENAQQLSASGVWDGELDG
jgi:hypothetical protein